METGDPLIDGRVEAETPAQPGVVRTFEHSYYPRRSKDGRIMGVSCVVADITERQRVTTELQRVNERLRELDQEKTRFLTDVSHEIRTPLTVIRGEAEVTLRGEDKTVEEYKGTLARIVPLSVQVNTLVSDLLFLARPEADAVHMEMRPVLLEELLSEVAAEGQILARRKEIVFDVPQPDAALTVRGDVNRLRQVLMILIDNGIKFTEAGGNLEIRSERARDHAKITVSDTGIGIPLESQAHVFERFYRVPGREAMSEAGSGLGLSIAKQIIEAHCGTIALASTPGVGTTVTILLPLLI